MEGTAIHTSQQGNENFFPFKLERSMIDLNLERLLEIAHMLDKNRANNLIQCWLEGLANFLCEKE